MVQMVRKVQVRGGELLWKERDVSKTELESFRTLFVCRFFSDFAWKWVPKSLAIQSQKVTLSLLSETDTMICIFSEKERLAVAVSLLAMSYILKTAVESPWRQVAKL